MARKVLVVTDSMAWTAETEYAVEVARAEQALGWDVTLAAPSGSAASAAGRFARSALSQESFVEGVSRVLETTGGRN